MQDARSGPGRAGSAQAEWTVTHAALVELAGGGPAGEAKAVHFWRRVAGVLHLGQLRFEGALAEDDDEPRGARHASYNGGRRNGSADEPPANLRRSVSRGVGEEAHLIEETRVDLHRAAALLDVNDVRLLEYSLCNRTIGGGRTPRTPHDAAVARDALAKAFYAELFEELVEIVNQALRPPGAPSEPPSLHGSGCTIGLLDIFGSEVFDKNNFEQLLINYANDKLQNYFKQTTVGRVRELYESEEIGLMHLPSAEPPPSLVLLEGTPPSLSGRDRMTRLKAHFNLPPLQEDAVVIATLEAHLGMRVPDGKTHEQRRDAVFKLTYRASLLQLLVDRGNYSDRANHREHAEVHGDGVPPLLRARSSSYSSTPSTGGLRPRSNSARGIVPPAAELARTTSLEKRRGGAPSAPSNAADESIGEAFATACVKYPAYVTAGKFDSRPVGLSWRYDLESNAGGEWLKVGAFEKAKTQHAGFGVQHFGSIVFYDVEHFTEKNNDYLDADLTKLLPRTSGAHDNGLERKTVAGKFKTEMRRLVDDTLAASAGHFIRCIKPNHEQQRFKLNSPSAIEHTLQQLNCCGVLEAAQISAAGFPNRLEYHAFLHSYSFHEARPLFIRHGRQRFTNAREVGGDAPTRARRVHNLAARFPARTEADIDAALSKHRGHAGRAAKSLDATGASPGRHRHSMGASGASALRERVRRMVLDVFRLEEDVDFVMGRTMLFLRAHVLAKVQTFFGRMERCRERVGQQMYAFAHYGGTPFAVECPPLR